MASFAPPTSPTISAGISRASTDPLRRPSLSQSLLDSNPHYGICAATGDALASAPSLKDLRRNSITSSNSGSRSRSGVGRRGSGISAAVSPGVGGRGVGAIHEEVRQPAVVDSLVVTAEKAHNGSRSGSGDGCGSVHTDTTPPEQEEHQPHWWAVTKSGLHAFWKWFITPLGFFITIYMLNVIAWGGMLFLLLINASPAMCHPSCNDINSPRRVWIEIDSQILNALFCVTGFGLIPWRFRDLWFLLRWRVWGRKVALARLEVIHQGWFRGPRDAEAAGVESGVEGSVVGGGVERGRMTEQEEKTGRRAPPTKSWKMDLVVWFYVWNTFLQAVLSGFMWGMNRIERPSWSTGLFVALACIVAGAAGGIVWWEGRRVKRIEGEEEKPEKEGKGEKREVGAEEA